MTESSATNGRAGGEREPPHATAKRLGQEFQAGSRAWFNKRTMEDQSMPVELRLDAQPHPQHSGMFRVRVSGVDGGQKLRACLPCGCSYPLTVPVG